MLSLSFSLQAQGSSGKFADLTDDSNVSQEATEKWLENAMNTYFDIQEGKPDHDIVRTIQIDNCVLTFVVKRIPPESRFCTVTSEGIISLGSLSLWEDGFFGKNMTLIELSTPFSSRRESCGTSEGRTSLSFYLRDCPTDMQKRIIKALKHLQSFCEDPF